MKFNKRPVNSLNLEFLQELVSTLDTLEKDKECRGLIFTSVSYLVTTIDEDIGRVQASHAASHEAQTSQANDLSNCYLA